MNESTRKIKEVIKNTWKKWKWRHNSPKPVGCSKSGPRREVYSNTGLYKEVSKIWNKQPNLPPKEARKRTTNKA